MIINLWVTEFGKNALCALKDESEELESRGCIVKAQKSFKFIDRGTRQEEITSFRQQDIKMSYGVYKHNFVYKILRTQLLLT